MLRKWRILSEYGIRETARGIGISPSTLSRVERGEDMDAKTLALILNWLMLEVK